MLDIIQEICGCLLSYLLTKL